MPIFAMVLPRVGSVHEKLVNWGKKIKKAVTPTPMDYSTGRTPEEEANRSRREHSSV